MKITQMPNRAGLPTHDLIASIDSIWEKVIAQTGLNSAELLAISYFDPARRVYALDKRVYKITLLAHEVTSGLRAQTLQGEYTILKKCTGISGVPTAFDWRLENDFEILIMERIDGETADDQGLSRFLLVLCKLCVINFRLSCRGVSHNDIKNANVLLANDGHVSLIDFDQATPTSFFVGILRSFFGIQIGEEKVHGSLMTVVKEYLRARLSPRALSVIKKLAGRQLKNKLPILEANASSSAKMLLEAWRIAQASDASAPKVLVAYYSFNYEGKHFPGERSWESRWKVLRSITDYSNKRVLELGCNMSLLSCFLLKEAKASAVMGVDIDKSILQAAGLVSSALGVAPEYRRHDFDAPDDWEGELKQFKPDTVFALNVLNWINDKERFLSFLGSFNEVIFEGHDDFETEKNRFLAYGFKDIKLVSITERRRPVMHCLK